MLRHRGRRPAGVRPLQNRIVFGFHMDTRSGIGLPRIVDHDAHPFEKVV